MSNVRSGCVISLHSDVELKGSLKGSDPSKLSQNTTKYAVDETRRIRTAEFFGNLDRFIDCTFYRDRGLPLHQVRVNHLEQCDPQNRSFEWSNAIDRPPN